MPQLRTAGKTRLGYSRCRPAIPLRHGIMHIGRVYGTGCYYFFIFV